MFQRISILKHKGYYPDLILDIGAYIGNWTKDMMKIYNNCNYFLFEAIDYNELNNFSSVENVKTFNIILNENECDVEWYEKRNTGDSMFKELSKHFINCSPITRNSIDLNTFLERNSISTDNYNNVLIKIDCQGAEIPILKGASNILKKTDFIILEIPLFGVYNTNVPTFEEHIKYMNSIGFIPFDIVDNHYINEFNMQIDMMFINKNHNFNKIVNDELL